MLDILTACPQLINSFKYVCMNIHTSIFSTLNYAFNGRAFKSHLTFFHLVINKCDSRLLIPTIRYHHYQKELLFIGPNELPLNTFYTHLALLQFDL